MTATPNSIHIPRLPLEVHLDLTYRCNNQCRHCWICLPPGRNHPEPELTLQEIERIVTEARSLGTRSWTLSGGEPMLRPDFSEIFDMITHKAVSYSLNTNGTLITPSIARQLTRKGFKMVALYGATADVHDHITRNPGSFEAAIRGMRYLNEAGAAFTVQIVPLKDNIHQLEQMEELAGQLSPRRRIGAAWLYLRADGDPVRNREIIEQRLDPQIVATLDPLKPGQNSSHQCGPSCSRQLFAECIEQRRNLHIDPYGNASFCSFVTDPALRASLRRESLEAVWERFIPALKEAVPANDEYDAHCGSCHNRSHCRWCPVFARLEHGRHTAKIDYLCRAAEENIHYTNRYEEEHVRYFQIAGITIRMEADRPLNDGIFSKALRPFLVSGPGEDPVNIRHHFEIPPFDTAKLGQPVYKHIPWEIYENGNVWHYLGLPPDGDNSNPFQISVFNHEHSDADIFNSSADAFTEDGLHSLANFPSDQIWLARLLAHRNACYLHGAGIALRNQGLLFLGHSGAGKSTITTMLMDAGTVLCDDRVILRRWPDGFRVHGTWHHGDIPLVSPLGVPLKGIFLLEQADENRLLPVTGAAEKSGILASVVIRPVVSRQWWNLVLDLIDQAVGEVPLFRLRFDLSGGVKALLEGYLQGAQ